MGKAMNPQRSIEYITGFLMGAFFGLGLALALSGNGEEAIYWLKRYIRNAKGEDQAYVPQAKQVIEKFSSG